MRNQFRRIFCHFVLAFSWLFLATGCVHLSTEHVQQKQYAISVSMPTSKNITKSSNQILDIYYPEASPQFAEAGFVYRSNALNYTSDYYNAFFGSPTEQIYQNLIKYLQATKIFKYAAGNVYPFKSDYILKTNVLELYADYRNFNAPKAVIALHFVLLDVKKAEPKIVLNKTYRKEVVLREKSSPALVDAWTKGLKNILQQLSTDLVISSIY